MTGVIKNKTFPITKGFEKIYEDFLTFAKDDVEFKELLDRKQTKTGEIDRRYRENSQNKLEGIKIRFVIAKYVREQKRKQLQQKE